MPKNTFSKNAKNGTSHIGTARVPMDDSSTNKKSIIYHLFEVGKGQQRGLDVQRCGVLINVFSVIVL